MSNEGVPVCGNQDEERRLSSCENTDPNRKESLGGVGPWGWPVVKFLCACNVNRFECYYAVMAAVNK